MMDRALPPHLIIMHRVLDPLDPSRRVDPAFGIEDEELRRLRRFARTQSTREIRSRFPDRRIATGGRQFWIGITIPIVVLIASFAIVPSDPLFLLLVVMLTALASIASWHLGTRRRQVRMRAAMRDGGHGICVDCGYRMQTGSHEGGRNVDAKCTECGLDHANSPIGRRRFR